MGLGSFFRALFAPKTRTPEPDDEPEDDPADAPGAVHRIAISESIDLHFFAPRDIPSVVHEYLFEAQAMGFDEVRLIHGRGKGIQRQRVQKVAARHPAVLELRSDGLGSTLARLRKSSKKIRR